MVDAKLLSDDAKRRLQLAGFILPTAMEPTLPVTTQPSRRPADAMPYRGNCRQSRPRSRSRCASGESRRNSSVPATAGSFASSRTPHDTTGDIYATISAPRTSGGSGSSFESLNPSTKPFSPSAFFKTKLHRAAPRTPPQSPPLSCPRVIFIDCAPRSSNP